jgi:hypothetical protein
VETLYFLHSESSFNKKLIQSHKQWRNDYNCLVFFTIALES